MLKTLACAFLICAASSAAATEALDPSRAGKPVNQTLIAQDKTKCCMVCKKGIPCGNSCISANKTCRKGPGCAC